MTRALRVSLTEEEREVVVQGLLLVQSAQQELAQTVAAQQTKDGHAIDMEQHGKVIDRWRLAQALAGRLGFTTGTPPNSPADSPPPDARTTSKQPASA